MGVVLTKGYIESLDSDERIVVLSKAMLEKRPTLEEDRPDVYELLSMIAEDESEDFTAEDWETLTEYLKG